MFALMLLEHGRRRQRRRRAGARRQEPFYNPLFGAFASKLPLYLADFGRGPHTDTHMHKRAETDAAGAIGDRLQQQHGRRDGESGERAARLSRLASHGGGGAPSAPGCNEGSAGGATARAAREWPA